MERIATGGNNVERVVTLEVLLNKAFTKTDYILNILSRGVSEKNSPKIAVIIAL